MRTSFKIAIAATIVTCGALVYLVHRSDLRTSSGTLRKADHHTVDNSSHALPNTEQVNQEIQASVSSGGSTGASPAGPTPPANSQSDSQTPPKVSISSQNDSGTPPRGDQAHNTPKQQTSPSSPENSTNPFASKLQIVDESFLEIPEKLLPGQRYYVQDGEKFILGQINQNGEFVPVTPPVIFDTRHHVLSLAHPILGVRKTYIDSSGQTVDEVYDPEKHIKRATITQSK